MVTIPDRIDSHILFVESENSIHRSIEREFMESECRLHLAASTEEGFHVLENEPIDVVICDLEIEECTGLDFLRTVKEEHPNSHRVILSDGRDPDRVGRAVTRGYATCCFPKPWEEENLKKGIHQILKIRGFLQQRKLLEAINVVDRLPSLPNLYSEFVEALFEDRSAEEMAKIIERDASLSARILQIANSAFYGSMNIFTVQQALVRMGLHPIKDLVLTFSLVNEMEWTADQFRQLRSIFSHSSLVNRHFKKVYETRQGRPLRREFASAGILHDIGSVLILQYFPERFESTLSLMQSKPGMTFAECEKRLGYQWFSHSEIGAYFLNHWSLPDSLVETTLFHHMPEESDENLREEVEALAFTDRIVALCELTPEDQTPALSDEELTFLPEAKIRGQLEEIQQDLKSQEFSVT